MKRITYDLELAAVIHALKMWRHHLIGRKFTLMTDNKGLKYLLDQPNLNARQARWLAFLSEYDFKIQHIKGKENKVADALSRNAKLNFTTTINTYNSDLDEQLTEGIKLDEIYQKLQATVKEEPTESLIKGYSLNKNGFLLFKDKLYVPNVPKVKLLILDEFHKTPYSGHPGYQKTVTMLRKEYFWPNMKSEVVEYIARCLDCQQVKTEHQHLAGLLQPLPIPS